VDALVPGPPADLQRERRIGVRRHQRRVRRPVADQFKTGQQTLAAHVADSGVTPGQVVEPFEQHHAQPPRVFNQAAFLVLRQAGQGGGAG
jgi:hypothetical protein